MIWRASLLAATAVALLSATSLNRVLTQDARLIQGATCAASPAGCGVRP